MNFFMSASLPALEVNVERAGPSTGDVNVDAVPIRHFLVVEGQRLDPVRGRCRHDPIGEELRPGGRRRVVISLDGAGVRAVGVYDQPLEIPRPRRHRRVRRVPDAVRPGGGCHRQQDAQRQNHSLHFSPPISP